MENNEKNLKTNYIFIDYENVQPSSFELIKDIPFKVFLFLGSNQTKIPVELATSMHSLGDQAEYIQIEGNGKNALDFHIAFYFGKFYEKDSNGYFHIISKDSGFDVLIKHLRAQKILIQRHISISDIPILKISNSKSLTEKIEAVVNYLHSRGNAKPRKILTLSNTINTLFMKKLSTDELERLINELKSKKLIIVDGTKIHYQLSKE